MDILQWQFVAILLLCFAAVIGGISKPDYDDDDGKPTYNRCPWIKNKLKNGRVKVRSRGRIARFVCNSGFELMGKRFASCIRGQWSNPLPYCVARGCYKMPEPVNGKVTEMNNGAVLLYHCNPGYSLQGPSALYCDGSRWNDASPVCDLTHEIPELTCDFEDPDLCGWSNDPTQDFEWRRNQLQTPSGHVGTGPSFDHTFGQGKAGFYLYLEASAPRKENDICRLFSPVYSPYNSPGCFTFWYHMYGETIGSLRVYFKPESYVFGELKPWWEMLGDQGNQWLRGEISVREMRENFQFIIEGVRGSGYVGDVAIDDVALWNMSCDLVPFPNETLLEGYSCRGRCREYDAAASCDCTEKCIIENTCCSDYVKICTSGNDSSLSFGEILPDDTSSTSSAVISNTTLENEVIHDLQSSHNTIVFTSIPPEIVHSSYLSISSSTEAQLTSENTKRQGESVYTSPPLVRTESITTASISSSSATKDSTSASKRTSSTTPIPTTIAVTRSLTTTTAKRIPLPPPQTTTKIPITTATIRAPTNVTTIIGTTTIATTITSATTTTTQVSTSTAATKVPATTGTTRASTTVTIRPSTTTKASSRTTADATSTKAITIISTTSLPSFSKSEVSTRLPIFSTNLSISNTTAIKANTTVSPKLYTLLTTPSIPSLKTTTASTVNNENATNTIPVFITTKLPITHRTSPSSTLDLKPVTSYIPTISTQVAGRYSARFPPRRFYSTTPKPSILPNVTVMANTSMQGVEVTTSKSFTSSPIIERMDSLSTSIKVQTTTQSSQVRHAVQDSSIQSSSVTQSSAATSANDERSPKSIDSDHRKVLSEDSKTKTISYNSSLTTSICIILALVFIAGVLYYLFRIRKLRKKPIDDSEIKFLSKNEVLELYDATE